MENLKFKVNFLKQKIVTSQKGVHCFLEFSSSEIGSFQVYSKEPFSFNYLDEVILNLEPSVINGNLGLRFVGCKKA